MDVKTYCDSIGIELTAWKAKLYDVIRKTELLAADEKGTSGRRMVADLNAIIDDLNERIDFLTRECPADWSSHKAEIEDKLSQINDKWKEVWGAMGEPEYGLGGA